MGVATAAARVEVARVEAVRAAAAMGAATITATIWASATCAVASRAVARAAAATAYQKAFEQQPMNWLLMSEIAKFLTFTLRAPESGLAMSRAALALNRSCSSDLWNTYGDSLFVLGRHAEAKGTFQRALRINPNDARAWYNLSFVYTQGKDHAAALDAIAKGMLLDGAGEFREGFLQKQSEILAHVASRHKQELQLQANRLNRYPSGLARRRKEAVK
jgi:tetratricopeptide (TPR) repeat protein